MSFSKKAREDAREENPINPFAVDGDPDIIAVFDGDELAFKIAAAAEERGVLVKNNDYPEGTGIWKNRTEFKKFMTGVEYDEAKFSIEDTQIAEPIQNAKSTIKSRIAALCKKCNAGSYEVYLSGTDNFRDSLPLPKQYKWKRKEDTSPKPLLLKELRDYLIEHKGGIVVDGQEADDMITTRMWDGYTAMIDTPNKKIIGITQDKDATQSMGWYLHPDKAEEPFFIDGLGRLWIDSKVKNEKPRGYGRIFLYYQCLIGDSVDSYNPRDLVKHVFNTSPRFGEKAAYNALRGLKTDKECLQVVVDIYKKWFGVEPFTYKAFDGSEHTMDYIGALQLYWDCAYMRRWEGDRVDVRHVLKILKVI